ncbi:MAG: glycerol-3-phosphate dehydrogenase/oxidase, partial [Candidatus Obscuribacterales bacterium]|nr:glycerol-3-phosphate dehydrogenase/oxidase [Candidatus Obscuribacterales bacterium]
ATAHVLLNKKKISSLTPAFSEKIVSSGIQFHDAVTDDTRMVLTVLKAAEQHGATLLNYVQVNGFQIENQKITGVNCHDRYSGQEFSVSCKVCVNATGVWSDEVSALIDSDAEKRVTPSKGIHIVVPSSAFETNTALFLPSKDARFIFLLPWKHALMIGTTETAYTGDIENLRANEDEIAYLLSVVNSYTNSHKLNRSDVKATFAGLRPLVNLNSENKTNTSTMSREHVIFDSPSGLINIAGGKLTSYRLMAEELINTLTVRYPGLAKKAFGTENAMLGGWTSKEDFLAKTAGIGTRARRMSIDPATIQHLIENYGAEAEQVLDIVEKRPALAERIISDFPPIMAEVQFCVENEMAVSLQDFFFRRTRLGIINHRQSMEAAPRVADLMAECCGWEDYRKKMELSVLEGEMFDRQTEEVSPVNS